MNGIIKTTLWITIGAVGAYAVYRRVNKTKDASESFSAWRKFGAVSGPLYDFKVAQAEREEQLKQGLAID